MAFGDHFDPTVQPYQKDVRLWGCGIRLIPALSQGFALGCTLNLVSKTLVELTDKLQTGVQSLSRGQGGCDGKDCCSCQTTHDE